jgi:tRNA modification GTPase
MNDTIFALASAPGRAAVAVFRISGPGSGPTLAAMVGGLPRRRLASLRLIRDPTGEIIDKGLALWFPGPHSYTGEDCAELHAHGGRVVIDRLVETLVDAGVRLAAPGEFTRRAFENGKLGLDQAEAVADLIEAQTIAQARQAIGQLGGSLGRRHEVWRGELVRILADLEAAVDFPDEEIPPDVGDRARAPIEALLGDLDRALADHSRGQRIRDGYRVAIIGATNAGKSTLFNGLLQREAAIVTPVPGATRDVIEAPLTLAGYQVVLADMAGIRTTGDAVEKEGVRRARQWASEAALRLWVVDGSSARGDWRLALDLVDTGDLCLINKSDLPANADREAAEEAAQNLRIRACHVSLAAAGVAGVRRELEARVIGDLAGADFPAATRARHTALLSEARADLARAFSVLGHPELAAEDVRRAARNLSRVTGRIGAEDVLDVVFASFCIGK